MSGPKLPGPNGEPRTRHFGRGHITALDGMRGVAVLGVVAVHLFYGNATAAGRFGVLLQHALDLGASGVDLFFVLSGFLITGILRDSIEDGQFFRKFYARRVLRIFPLYYGVLLVLLLCTVPLHIRWHGSQASFLLYLQNTTFLPSLADFGNQRWINLDHLWSLAVEEQFYLVWPFIVFLVRKPRWLLAVCGAGIAGSLALRLAEFLHGSSYYYVSRSTLCRADTLLAGAALALLVRSRHGVRLLPFAGTVAVLTFVLYVFRNRVLHLVAPGHTPDWNFAWSTALGFTLMALCGSAMLVSALGEASLLKRIFEWKVLRFFGKYSYGLYVLHALPLPALVLLLVPLRNAGASPMAARIIMGLLGIAVAVPLAYFSFHFYEKRFLKLKRFFDYTPQPSPRT